MRSGFTLVELLISLAIFAGLLVILMNVLGMTSLEFSRTTAFQRPMEDIINLRFFVTNCLNTMEGIRVYSDLDRIIGKYTIPRGRIEARLLVSSSSVRFEIDDPTTVELASLVLKNITIDSISKDGSFVVFSISLPNGNLYDLYFGGE